MAEAKPKVSVIGVGAMGHGIAGNLLTKGFPTTIVGNRNRAPGEALVKRGAVEAANPAAAAQRSDIVLICVQVSPQVEAIVLGPDGVLSAARPGLIVVDCTTSEPESTARLAAALAAKGVPLADAPLARTPKEAEAGRLNAMVGAAPDVFPRIEPVLKAFCENIFHVGGAGAGHKTKLVYNLLTMGQAALIAEALATAAKSGLDIEAFSKVVAAGAANSGIYQMIVPSARAGTYDGLKFGLDLARKDLRYYTHMAEAIGVPSIMGEAAHQSFVQASALGFGEGMVGNLVAAQEKITGAKVRRS